MTTIVYRGGVMAADTATFIQDGAVQIPGNSEKIRRLEDGSLFAAAGVVSQGCALAEWIEKRRDERPKTDDLTALHVARDGTVTIYDGAAERVVRAPFYAIGSGSGAALGAMYAGADALDAVRIAMLIDPYTAGEVMTMGIGCKDSAKED